MSEDRKLNFYRRDAKKLPILARIRNNATGEIREHEDYALLDEDETEPSDFMWSEGNFSCDCNRRLFFQSKDEPGDWELPCSDGLYSVQLTNLETGKVYYDEFA